MLGSFYTRLQTSVPPIRAVLIRPRTIFQRLDQASQLVAGIQTADNILGRRLQQTDDLADEILLALQRGQRLELVVPFEYVPVDKGRLQYGLFTIAGLTEVGDDQSRLFGILGEQQRSYAVQGFVHAGKTLVVDAFQGLLDQGVLSHLHLYLLVEADAAQLANLFYGQ